MSKKLLFFADGTWDGPDSEETDPSRGPTNVCKLFENLDGTDDTKTVRSAKERERKRLDPEGSVLQHAKYLHGVGDSKNPLAYWAGGILGAGLVAQIVRGYTFLSRNYVEGDGIFIVGFSRGAYTARALAGLIAARGLLSAKKNGLTDADADKRRAYDLGLSVWHAERQARLKDNPSWLGKIEQIVNDESRSLIDPLHAFPRHPLRADQLVPVDIAAVAVWDTVGSLGIPEYNFEQHTRVDCLQFADLKLSSKVSRGFHAVAIDEMRPDFTPTLWDPDPDRIMQVLFAGAHGDVGGGYPPTADGRCLSDGPLKWMTEQLALLRVQFRPHVAKPDARAILHRPWLSGWSLLAPRARAFPAGLWLSGMVLERLGGGHVPVEDKDGKDLLAPYRPSNLSIYLAGETAAPGITIVRNDATTDAPPSPSS